MTWRAVFQKHPLWPIPLGQWQTTKTILKTFPFKLYWLFELFYVKFNLHGPGHRAHYWWVSACQSWWPAASRSRLTRVSPDVCRREEARANLRFPRPSIWNCGTHTFKINTARGENSVQHKLECQLLKCSFVKHLRRDLQVGKVMHPKGLSFERPNGKINIVQNTNGSAICPSNGICVKLLHDQVSKIRTFAIVLILSDNRYIVLV